MKKNTWLKAFIPSLILMALGALLAVLKIGMRFEGAAAHMIRFSQMGWSIVIIVAFALIYGFVRYDKAGALTLSAAVLHDMGLSLATASLLGAVLKLSLYYPVTLMLTVVFTFCQSIPVMREARKILRSSSRKETPMEVIPAAAVKQTNGVRMMGMQIAILLIAVGLLAGNAHMLSLLAPLAVSLLVSVYTATSVTGVVWQAASLRFRNKKN